MFEIDTAEEEKLSVTIAEVIGVLFKTHPDQCTELFTLIYTKFLPLVLADNVSSTMNQFGIFLVDDIVEFLGF